MLSRIVACLLLCQCCSSADVIKSFSELGGVPYEVSYNSRSILVAGKPVLLLSGSVHYVRSTPEMWPQIFAKMKAAGLNAVESYVFWNYHVPTSADRDSPDYSGRGNVTLFLELAAKADLFVIWRIGPYICAEWPGGGLPSWLKSIGAKPRSATQPYMNETYKWMHQHIELVRPFFAEKGGPIIMTQMENELSGSSDTPYVKWLGELADELHTNLPWIMCHGAHANNTIETCNGCDCTNFVDGLVKRFQPAMWTEDEQWFDRFAQGAAVRPTGDLGRSIAAFIAAGGSMHNFYMFHGGTMWGNWSTTVRRTRLTPSYANTANLASDSIVYNPKYSKIASLHHVFMQYVETILHTPVPIARTSTGRDEWRVTMNGTNGDSPISFLFNDGTSAASTVFHGKSYSMAPRSSMIFDVDGKMLWYSEPSESDSVGQPYLQAADTTKLKWTTWNDTDGKRGTWYRTTFARPSLPKGAQLSINMTGFGQGNLFLNGVHVVYFNLQFGECYRAPGGVNPHGTCDTYIWERCDKPTQDCYHVPPEWIQDQNELLVWNDPKLPPNISIIDPALSSVVYRVDPPGVQASIANFAEVVI